MTATYELRAMLDEQGVEHLDYKASSWSETTAWDIDKSDPLYEVCAGFEEFGDGVTLLRFWNAIPEQAIAATLGEGTCRVESVTLEDGMMYCYEHVLSCGHSFDWPWSMPVKYCPECGRRVVDE